MPYELVQQDGQTCVRKVGGDVVPGGCHDDEEEAERHLTALRIAEQEEGGKAAPDGLDEAWDGYQAATNMTASQLEAWADTECSKLASNSREPIERNLRLLRTPKADWDAQDVEDANRTISFVARMTEVEQGEPAREGCPSKRDISLKNWAHDPQKGASMQHTEKADAQGVPEGLRDPEQGVTRTDLAPPDGQQQQGDEARPAKAGGRPHPRPQLDQRLTKEHKPLLLDVKEVSARGEFTGYASVFGNRDLQGDVMERGAFTKTIEASGGMVPILDQHDERTEIGLTLGMEEDAHGLKVRGQLYIDNEDARNEVPEARSAFVRMRRRARAGLPQQMSIGYRTIKRRWKDGVRYLQEVALGEVSTVTFAANPMATVSTVKAHGMDAAGAVDRAIATAESHLLALRQLRDMIGAPPMAPQQPDAGAGGGDDDMQEPDQDAAASDAVERLIETLEQALTRLQDDEDGAL